jgi:hypothetical protein
MCDDPLDFSRGGRVGYADTLTFGRATFYGSILEDHRLVTTGLDPVVHAASSLLHGLPGQARQ